MFGNFLKSILPAVGGFLGGPVGGAIGGGVAGWLGGRQEARGYERAGQQGAQNAMAGFNYMQGSPLGQQYLPAGGAAIDQMRALSGLGGDPEAARRAFEDWQGSTGFQSQLDTGSRAISGNRAAAGLLGSGSTAKALTRFGQDLGQQSFGNYFNQLSGIANTGMQAGQAIGGAATQGGIAGAGMQYGAGMGAAGARAGGWDSLMGGIGGALDAWNAGRTPRNNPGPAVPPRVPAQLAPIPQRPYNFIRTVR